MLMTSASRQLTFGNVFEERQSIRSAKHHLAFLCLCTCVHSESWFLFPSHRVVVALIQFIATLLLVCF